MSKIKNPPKYKSKKIIVDGIKFDSKAEGDYFLYLKSEKEKGNIDSIELQPIFELQTKFKHGKKGNIRSITYKADFFVFSGRDQWVVDVKGMATPLSLLKRKLFLYIWPHLDLLWVTKSKKYSDTGWIDYFELEKIRKENRRLKKL